MRISLESVIACLDPSTPLPGQSAREALTPAYRRGRRGNDGNDVNDGNDGGAAWRQAAVLILLYEAEGEFRFPLIIRAHGDGVHAGQVGLPGGAVEGGESHGACALRECREELGASLDGLSPLRELSPLEVPPSGFIVHPFVGYLGARPSFTPEPAEVAGYFEPSLVELLDPAAKREDRALWEGQSWRVPYYALRGQRVWGATAMILAELEAMLGMADRFL